MSLRNISYSEKIKHIHWAKAFHLIANVLRRDLLCIAQGRKNLRTDLFAGQFRKAPWKGDIDWDRCMGLGLGRRLGVLSLGSRGRRRRKSFLRDSLVVVEPRQARVASMGKWLEGGGER
jgi:hypothetical protein